MTGIMVTKIFIKLDRSLAKNFFDFGIVNHPLVYSPISNHNTLLSTILYSLMHDSFRNMIITLISQCKEVSNKKNRFIHSFVDVKTVFTLNNNIIFDIHNCLNNFILVFFWPSKFF